MHLGVEGTGAWSSRRPAGSLLWHGTAWPGCRPGVYGAAPFPGTFLPPLNLEKQSPTSCLFPNKLRASTHRLSSPTSSAGKGMPHHCWEQEPAGWPGSGRGSPCPGPATSPHQAGGVPAALSPHGAPSLSPPWPGKVPGAGVMPGTPGIRAELPYPSVPLCWRCWQRPLGKVGQGRMAHCLPGVHGDPRNGQVTPCPQPFIAVTLLGAADPGRGCPTVVPLSLPPSPGIPQPPSQGQGAELVPVPQGRSAPFGGLQRLSHHQPPPCPDREAEGVSQYWQEPVWPGGSRVAGAGMPCGSGEPRLWLRSIAGGCSLCSAAKHAQLCTSPEALCKLPWHWQSWARAGGEAVSIPHLGVCSPVWALPGGTGVSAAETQPQAVKFTPASPVPLISSTAAARG